MLIHGNVVNNSYQEKLRVYTFVPNKSFGQLLIFHSEILYFYKHLIQNLNILRHGLQISILNR